MIFSPKNFVLSLVENARNISNNKYKQKVNHVQHLKYSDKYA